MKKLIMYAVGLLLLASCNPLAKIETSYSDANKSYNDQAYNEAYTKYTNLIALYQSKDMEVPNNVYVSLAECALKTGKTEEAISNYKKALDDSTSVNTLLAYVDALKTTDKYNDVEKTLSDNKGYLESNGKDAYFNNEMFNAAIKLGDEQKILNSYTSVSNMSEEQTLAVINALDNQKNTKEALSLANKTIKNNGDYDSVKEWKAIYHYKFAEQWYKSEMDKYNKNKNYTAYVYLKRELKKISANYQISKDIFEELYKKYPNEDKYGKYLKNVYLRMDMKKEAEAISKKLN